MLAMALSATAAPSKSGATTVRAAIVTDIGGLNDKGVNHLSYVVLQRAQKQLAISGRAYITNSANDRLPNLRTAAQNGYQLVIGVGFLMYEPLDKIAGSFSDNHIPG